jgi:CRISPR type III-B/RAMP module-associated protein Cmr3
MSTVADDAPMSPVARDESAHRAWVLFQALDVLTFRDGRPFMTGMTSTARTTLPRPTSTGGALNRVFGCSPREVAGPVLVSLLPPSTALLPAPLDLVVDGQTGHRLHPDAPVPAGVVTDLSDRGRLEDFQLLGGEGEPSPRLLDAGSVSAYLDGRPEPALDVLTSTAGEAPLVKERRLGLARHERSVPGAGRTAVPGFLYLAEFWRPAVRYEEHLWFGCRVWFDDRVPETVTGVVPLGGESRQSRVMVVADEEASGALRLPAPPTVFPDGRLLLYLATPAIFPDGWLPPPAPGLTVNGACVAGPQPITGWSPADQAARPLRWSVDAGSVYFLTFDEPAAAQRFAERYHGRCLPQAERWMRTVGFGMCLVGRWS